MITNHAELSIVEQSGQERHESPARHSAETHRQGGEFLYIKLPSGVTRQQLLDEYQEMLQRVRELGEMPPKSQ